jgi:hypothetical protein
MDLRGILIREMVGTVKDPGDGDGDGDGDGALAIVLCGPRSMADDVRREIVEIVRSNPLSRAVVLLDEAFSW